MKSMALWATTWAGVLLFGAVSTGIGCGGNQGSGFGPSDGGGGNGDDGSGPADSGGATDTGGGLHLGGDSGAGSDSGGSSGDSGGTMGTPVVYAESPDTLYQLDPTTNAISIVAKFSGDCDDESSQDDGTCGTDCCDVIDLAIDESSNAYVTTFTGFYSLDLKTGATKSIAQGVSYPNSLSFVPKGTLDPTAEALVGYDGAQYVRIDTTTGAISNVGVGLSGGFSSSGDIVSVIGGGTFLTVTGPGCSAGDCLLQVDPSTGALIQNYGTTEHTSVFGIAFWAGTVYGFDSGGDVFSISYASGKITTAPIPVPSPPPGLQFWGAGSTTAAPKAQPDGGGIPVK
jgi:hypothetical protein